MKLVYFLIFGISLSINVFAQDTLLYDDYINLVRSMHPEAKQIELSNDRAERAKRGARGTLDPKLFVKYKNKEFKESGKSKSKEYYSIFDGGVELPTAIGVKFKAGYEKSHGAFLNPQNSVPPSGLTYVGISVPLGKGMLTDENRQAIRLAKINEKRINELNKIELNDLLLQATIAYSEWYFKYYKMKAIEISYNLALERFDYVKSSALQGELAILDTIKAYVQKQDRFILLREAYVDWTVSAYHLNNYLWDSTYQLKKEIIPPSTIADQLKDVSIDENALDSLVNNSPFILNYEFKLNALRTERLWKIEKLKPKLNVEYNRLFTGLSTEVPNDWSTNYRWGISASLPLFLRDERAQLKINKFKIQDAYYQIDLKQRELGNKIKATAYEFSNVSIQYSLLATNVTAYERLVAAERIKFNIGESDLFKLNAWETNYQQALIKRAKMESKLLKTKSKLDYLCNDF